MAIFLTLLVLTLFVVMFLSNGGESLSNWLRGQEDAAQAGPGSDNVPYVSDRFYDSGRATASVNGAFTFSGQITVDPIASYTQDGLSWISFIDTTNPGAGEVLVALGEPEHSVTVAQGPLAAIGRDEACDFDIEVTASTVSGTVVCESIEALRDQQPFGTASIQLQFSTTTTPLDGSGEPDGDDGDDGG